MNNEPKKLNFVFFGTPDVASETLEILISHGYIPSLIVTAPDKPVGRKFIITPSPVKIWATEHNIPFITPSAALSLERLPLLGGDSYDLFIVVAYGKILSQKIIDMPKLGTLNIHYSLLPRWRGASPVEAALLHGDTETGVSIQKMVFTLDAGPVVVSQKIPIGMSDTAADLFKKLIPLGAELLVNYLPLVGGAIRQLADGGGTEQDESLATYCKKIKKEDGLVNPFTDNPVELWNKYRAYFGWPGIYFFDQHNKRVKITHARFENGKFIIEKIIPEGKKEQNFQAPDAR